jgi:hypothetical protein
MVPELEDSCEHEQAEDRNEKQEREDGLMAKEHRT